MQDSQIQKVLEKNTNELSNDDLPITISLQMPECYPSDHSIPVNIINGDVLDPRVIIKEQKAQRIYGRYGDGWSLGTVELSIFKF